MPTPRGANFDENEVERILVALALSGGSVVKAQRVLEHDPHIQRVPHRNAMHKMRERYAERYTEVCAELGPRIEAQVVNDYRAIMQRAAAVQLQAIARTEEGIEELGAADAAAVARNLAVTAGISTEKAFLMTDRPTEIHARQNPDEILRAIEAIAGKRDPRHETHPALEETTIPDAEVVDE